MYVCIYIYLHQNRQPPKRAASSSFEAEMRVYPHSKDPFSTKCQILGPITCPPSKLPGLVSKHL